MNVMSNMPPLGRKEPLADPEPVPPVAPQPGDCCGEGCPHCVLDLYDAAVERYQADLAAWKVRQRSSQ
ncbi:MAG: oxidoreductase-like domain-containing protein [Pseudomonadota bacterium]|nr:oxidoreductase-like domain-containing protein [Pseudomonadota bacterium]